MRALVASYFCRILFLFPVHTIWTSVDRIDFTPCSIDEHVAIAEWRTAYLCVEACGGDSEVINQVICKYAVLEADVSICR